MKPADLPLRHLVAKKSNIHHKVAMGVLFDAYYDTETTDLNKRFAEITQFGGVVTDLAGNILHHVDLRAKISPYTVISPFAWLVQRLRYEDLVKGEPRALFMGKVKQFFEQSNNLSIAPFSSDFLELCREGKYKREGAEEERYYSYPVENDDGSIDWDYIRIHESLKKFYFKDPNTGQWVKRDIKAMTIGYNNVNADDQWLWTAAHMAGIENIFMTHLSQQGKFRLDALRVVEAAVVAGSRDINALQALRKKDPRTGEEFLSFSQGAILEANTHLASEVRGLLEGIVLPDGSFIDTKQLHGAYADALSLSALMNFTRARHPEIVRQMEMNADWKYVIDKLTEVKGGFGNSPPIAYIDKTYPTIDGKMVSLIGTDQQRNAPKVAVVWNLSINPKTYTYNGKHIEKITTSEWKQIIEDSAHNPNAPLKIIRAHKTPRLLDAETGYAAGFNIGLDRNEINDRIRQVRQAHITDAVMVGLRLAFPRLHGTDRVILPQPEEELFTFSTLELFDSVAGEDVQVHHRVQNKVEELAQKSRAHAMKVKALWLSAIQFDEPIFLKSEPEDSDVQNFLDKIKTINKKLAKEGGVSIPLPNGKVTDKKSALEYKLNILFYASSCFLEGKIQDIGHHFWFEDTYGIRLNANDVMKWPQIKIDEAYKSGNLQVRHERTYTTPLIIDRIIEEMGYAEYLGPDVCAQLDAYKALRRQGMPHHHGSGDRWYTVQQAKKDVAKIENNELTRADLTALEGIVPGAWDTFMTTQHDNVASLSEYKKYLAEISGPQLSAEMMPHVGIDPRTAYPIANYDFGVDMQKIHIVDVPDRYLEKPVIDPVTNRPVWILPLNEAFREASQKPSLSILFRAASTGRLYHIPDVRFLPISKLAPLPSRAGAYEDFYKQVTARYEDSGAKMPSYKNSMAVIGNGPYPLHNLREVNCDAQSLKLPRHLFEGLIAPKLAGYAHKPSGIILRDEALKIFDAPVRILETKDDGETGWEIETWVKSHRAVTLQDVTKFSDSELRQYGFSTKEQAIDHFSSLFANQRSDAKDPKNTAMAIAFGTIRPNDPDTGMMYFKPGTQVNSSVVASDNLFGGYHYD